MRHSQLKAFHHVALTGGFSRAAEAMFLSQPAISEQVRKLEQDHDVLLFHRQRKQVHLTPAGEQLFRFTKQYFEIEAQIGDHLSESSAAIGGKLRIIADSAHHVTGFLGRFRQKYPSVTIRLRTGNTEDILEELRAYNAEIAIVGVPSPDKDMQSVTLGQSKIVGITARGAGFVPGKSVTLEQLARLPLIFRETGSKTRQKLEEAARKQGITLTPVIVAQGREAVREVVASGAGIGFVSQAEFGHDDRLRQIELSDLDISMSESLIHLTQRREVKVIRAFMDFVRQELNRA